MRYYLTGLARSWLSILVLLGPLVAELSGQKTCGPISLEQAIETGLQNNKRLRAAKAAFEASGHRVKRARLDLLPKADLFLNYSRLDGGAVRRGNVFVDVGRSLIETFDAGDPNDIRPGAYSNNFSTAFQVVQPIYNGGANWAAVSLARYQEEGNEYALEETKQTILLEVKKRYLRVLQALEFVTLAEKSLELSQNHLKSTRNMMRVGLRNKTEVLRWEVQAATAEGALIEAGNSHEVALAALRQVMGIPYDEPIIAQPILFEPVPPRASMAEQIKKTMNFNPGLRAALASTDAQRAGVRLAWAAFQPKINFVYNLGWEQNNTFALDSFSYWSAGISLRMPIFHSLANTASLQQAKAELKRSEEEVREAESLLTLEVIRARLQVETAIQKYHIAQKTVEHTEENLRALDNSYNVGLAANIDVLDGQVINTRASLELINARYEYEIAAAELQKAMGVFRE